MAIEDCIASCAGLSTKRSWLGFGTSPQGRCQATCGKAVRYETGYGDPDEIFDIDASLDLAAEGAFWYGQGEAPDFSGVGNGFSPYASSLPTETENNTIYMGLLVGIGTLLYLGWR